MNINYIKLFFTLTFSITFAILIAGTTFKYWFIYDANALIKQANIEISKANEKRNNEHLIRSELEAKKAQKRKTQQIKLKNERDRKHRANKTKIETCAFWTKQYRKYPRDYEKNMVRKACK